MDGDPSCLTTETRISITRRTLSGGNSRLDPDVQASNTAWGWIAAAVFVAVLLAVAFGVGHQPGQGTNTASNDITPPPAATRMAPPATTTLPPAATPAPATPMMPAPAAPAQGSQ